MRGTRDIDDRPGGWERARWPLCEVPVGGLPLCTSHSINMLRVTPPRSILDLYHCLNVYFKGIGNRRVMCWIVLWARTTSSIFQIQGSTHILRE